MSSRPVILIVDDEKNTREGLVRALRGEYAVAEAENGQRALEWLETHVADVVLSDLRMPGLDGLDLLSRLLGRESKPIVILLTAFGSVETAVEAMKRGAYDFLAKPVNLDRLDLLLRRALAERRLGDENRRLKAQLDSKYGFENIIGASPAMQEVFETIRQAAPTRATVLIQGESGTGKELVARALHQCSPRRDGPFVPVHCAALAPTLLESELFGHEKGAFTGATERRRGRFELADGGTLFLDEIGEIDPALQVKILRVLEERKFERVGGTETLHVDVRLVAATNRDLRARVAEGAFREDLFYRLYVVNLTLPPLRERDGDVVLLAQHYLKTLAEENGKKPMAISPEAMDVLQAYPWPGNVRELRNLIDRAFYSPSRPIDLAACLHAGRLVKARCADSAIEAMKVDDAIGNRPFKEEKAELVDEFERKYILKLLKRNDGNVSKSSREAGIERAYLQRLIKKYGIEN